MYAVSQCAGNCQTKATRDLDGFVHCMQVRRGGRCIQGG